MSPDRRNLIEYMAREFFKTCPCGKCDCVSTPPEKSARLVLERWAAQAEKMSENFARNAVGFREIAAESLRSIKRIEKKYGVIADENRRGHQEALRYAEERERTSRRLAHAARLYRRLARGERPFAREGAKP